MLINSVSPARTGQRPKVSNLVYARQCALSVFDLRASAPPAQDKTALISISLMRDNVTIRKLVYEYERRYFTAGLLSGEKKTE